MQHFSSQFHQMAPQTYNFHAAYQYADPLIVLLHVSLRNSPRREAITQVILVFYHLTSAKNCREIFCYGLLWFNALFFLFFKFFKMPWDRGWYLKVLSSKLGLKNIRGGWFLLRACCFSKKRLHHWCFLNNFFGICRTTLPMSTFLHLQCTMQHIWIR